MLLSSGDSFKQWANREVPLPAHGSRASCTQGAGQLQKQMAKESETETRSCGASGIAGGVFA